MNIDEDTVKKWLVDEGMFRESKIDDSADFHFVIEFPKNNIMDVVKQKGKDFIVVACATHVSPQHLELMNSTSDKKKRNFILDLNMLINSFLVDFELQTNQNILQQFTISDQLFSDALSKNELIKMVKRVFKAKINCVWLIEKTFVNVNTDSRPSNENSMFI